MIHSLLVALGLVAFLAGASWRGCNGCCRGISKFVEYGMTELTSDATLGDLPLHDFQVSPKTLGKFLASVFAFRPELPGAIVADESRMLGMISRRRFNDWMSSPYGIDVFLESPIETFLNVITQNVELLQLPDTEKVDVAVKMALSRAAEDVYEPIVILYQDSSLPDLQAYFLLDFITLIRAQSQIFNVVNRQVNLPMYSSKDRVKLEQEHKNSELYNQAVQEVNQILQTQGVEIEKQAQEIAELNQKIQRIGQLISQEATKGFRKTFTGVKVIGRYTNQIVDIGKLLSEELERIQEISQHIKRASQQVKHLAVKAGIVANKSGTEMNFFSQITTEIATLVSQTFEAGLQMDRSANRFRYKIQGFTESANQGMRITKSLIQEIEQAEVALAELETLVQQQDCPLTAQNLPESITEAAANHQEDLEEIPEDSQDIVEKVALPEATISDVQELANYKDSTLLLRKIRRALHKYKTY